MKNNGLGLNRPPNVFQYGQAPTETDFFFSLSIGVIFGVKLAGLFPFYFGYKNDSRPLRRQISFQNTKLVLAHTAFAYDLTRMSDDICGKFFQRVPGNNNCSR